MSPENLKNMADIMWHLINNAQKVTLITHERPDGDGISACAAMDILLHKLGKETETIYPTEPEFAYTRQPETVLVHTYTFVPDLIIVLDTATRKRCYIPEEFANIPLIVIDHHISNDIEATGRIVDQYASSACEVLYELIMLWAPERIDKNIAEALMMGILYDTQVFRTTLTSSKTLRIVADLMEKGADLIALKDELLANKNPGIIKVWASFLQSVVLSPSGKSAWAALPKKDLVFVDGTIPVLVGFSNFLAEISHVDIIAIFYETEDGKTKVSLRSRIADVNALAKQFGGGGHIHASGIVMSMPLDECVKEVTRLFV
jgi:phosphoesterase RecJ-like protein